MSKPHSAARALIAFVLGAGGVAAFAPFHVWPLLIVSLAGLFALWFRAESKKQAALFGFCWGLGFFLFGVSWLYVSLYVYGNMPAPLAALAILLFCCYLSLFPLLAGLLARRLHAQLPLRPLVILLVVMPALFVLTEYLRGWFLSGFPWLIAGYSQTPGHVIGVNLSAALAAPLSGVAPVFGVFAISWIVALTAAAAVACFPAWSGLVISRPHRISVAVAVATLWAAGMGLQWIEWSAPVGKPLTVALLQGNIEQSMKWREDQRASTLAAYLGMVRSTQAKLIVLPETALPAFIDEVPRDYLDALKQHAEQNGGDLIVGVPFSQRLMPSAPNYTYYNSAVSLGVSPPQRYDKQHLVAFGEFMPPAFSWVYEWLKIPLAGFTPGGWDQASMRLSGHRVAVNICYEDTFGDEIRRPVLDAELLVNVSNMAWYGHSLAADQHAQFSQMRALETSRWMLRATNTGVTAAIDEHGEIVKALPQFTRGVLEIVAQPRAGITPFVRWGDWPVLAGIALILFAVAFLARNSVGK